MWRRNAAILPPAKLVDDPVRRRRLASIFKGQRQAPHMTLIVRQRRMPVAPITTQASITLRTGAWTPPSVH
ncbi:unnamed protein product [Coffea canephora]|uniref:Uncharacterized protein n=1 Tax=Coffea canephora TaxID=49390 RepID=A0A068U9V5_COFCA|nr:unnamed protein product [Coffea canephora]